MKSTHTIATLEVSQAAHDEICIALEAAGYQHAFLEDGLLDMTGIGLHSVAHISDADILNWLERQHTLHRQVEALYVVDGYQVTITHDSEPIPGKEWHGETLREAYAKAMREWDTTHGNRDLIAERAEQEAAERASGVCKGSSYCTWGPRKDGESLGEECTKCGLVIPF